MEPENDLEWPNERKRGRRKEKEKKQQRENQAASRKININRENTHTYRSIQGRRPSREERVKTARRRGLPLCLGFSPLKKDFSLSISPSPVKKKQKQTEKETTKKRAEELLAYNSK